MISDCFGLKSAQYCWHETWMFSVASFDVSNFLLCVFGFCFSFFLVLLFSKLRFGICTVPFFCLFQSVVLFQSEACFCQHFHFMNVNQCHFFFPFSLFEYGAACE